MKKIAIILLAFPIGVVSAQDVWMDVDTAVTVPVNLVPLTTDGATADTGVTYNEAGLAMYWNFIATDGTITQTAFDPCNTGGDYDFTHVGGGMYKIEIPASGGADMNNDTEGFGWVSGSSTANYIWRGPTIGFRAAGTNNAMIDSAYSATRGLAGTALPNAAADAAGGLVISDAGGLDVDAKLAATNEITAARMGALTDWIDGGRLDLIIDAILDDTDDIGVAGAGLAEAGGTGDHLTAVPWNAAWDTEVESEVDDALGSGTGTALSAIPWNASWDTEVQSEATDALNAYDPPTKTELDSGFAALNDVTAEEVWEDPNASNASAASIADAVWDEATSGHVAANSFGSLAKDVNDNAVAILEDTGTTLDNLVDDLESRLGTPTDFGSGTSTIAANLQDLSDNGTAAFDRSTDSLQAIRDRGDAAWTTGAGGSAPTVEEIRTEMDANSTSFASILTELAEQDANDVTILANQTTAQSDLDTLTGTDGATLATAQGNYAPSKAGDEMDLVDAPNGTAVTAIQSGLSTLTQTQVTGGAYALDTDANGRIRIVDGTSAGELDTSSGLVQLLAATQASIDAIEADTSAQDTAGEWTTLMGNGSGLTEAGGTGDQFTALPTAEEIMEDANAPANLFTFTDGNVHSHVKAGDDNVVFDVNQVDFFADSGTTYAGSAAGSVVKETADNAGGSSLSLDDIGDTVVSYMDANSTEIGGGSAASKLNPEYEIATVTSQFVFTLATGPTLDDQPNSQRRWALILDDSGSDVDSHLTKVMDYVGSSKTITIQTAAPFTVGADDSLILMTPDKAVEWLMERLPRGSLP